MPVAADKWVCNLCQDNKPHTQRAAKVHQKTRMHQDSIKYHTTKRQHCARDSSAQAEAPSLKDKSVAGLRLLLDDMANPSDFELGNSVDNVYDDYFGTTAGDIDSEDNGNYFG
jgi:hypothetical protein